MKQCSVRSLLAKAGIAAAALMGDARSQGEAELFEWPPEAGDATSFPRSVSVRLRGEERRDVAVLGNGHVVAWFEPSAHQMVALLDFGFVIHDAAALPLEQFELGGDRDSLVLAASDALRWGGINADGTVHSHVIDRSSSWRNARRVLAADLTGDGRVDLVVLKSDGCTLSVKRQTETGPFVDEPAMGVIAAAAVRDVALAEFDGDPGAPELVVVDDGGLRVYALDGTVLATHDSVRADLDAITVLRGDGTADHLDRVLWSTAAFADPIDPTRLLFVVDGNGAALSTMTTEPITALASGRLDFDGTADAVAMLGLEERLALLYAQFDPSGAASGFDFDPDHSIVLDLLPPGSGVVAPATALVTDLGHDGFEDLFEPLATARKVLVIDGPLARSGSSEATSGSTAPDFVHAGACFEPLGANGGRIIFARAVFPGVSSHSSDASWKLEHRVYVKPQGALYLVPMPTSSCSKPVDEYEVGALDTLEIGFECPDVLDAHYLYLRVVHVNGSGMVDEAGPALLGVFTEDPVAKDEILAGLIAPGWTIENVEACAAGGTRVAGFGRVRRIPPPPPGLPPPPPPLNNCHDHTH